MKSDAQLLRESRSDPGAFRELYDRHAERIYVLVLRRAGDPDAAPDLTAETFAQAWLSRRRFRDRSGGLAGPWLCGIARNLIAQTVRSRRIELAACTKLGIRERLDRPGSDPTEPNTSWLVGLDDALAELREGERRAVELRVLEGLSYDEIAAGLATSPGAARVRVTRGLGRLRDRFIRKEQEAV